ncbi:hypothetical protein SAMN04488499_10036 [Sporomusa acidovorans]|nr:hypothetical protein SPACI_31460 [Sporomusa acidovorans DSM 3132]SDD66060.1 hypothetical protein SAMN04488499_10036 [Sporomusa acidovorans]
MIFPEQVFIKNFTECFLNSHFTMSARHALNFNIVSGAGLTTSPLKKQSYTRPWFNPYTG